MKIAITSDNDTIETIINPRFGRCRYFLIVDIEGENITNIEAFENQGAIQGHGAGFRAAQQVGDLNVDAVITGNLGPNAANVLNQLGIKAYNASGKASDAINNLVSGNLHQITDIVEAHAGLKAAEDDTIPVNEPKIEKDTKSERIFIPLLNDKGEESEISEHFGHAPFFAIYDTETKELKILDNKLDHSDNLKSPVDQVIDAANPTIVFAKGIGSRAIKLFNEKGVKIRSGNYNTPKQVIENLDNLDDQIESCGH